MTDLEGCIRFWESKLKDEYLLDPSVIVLIKMTIKFLKELQNDSRTQKKA